MKRVLSLLLAVLFLVPVARVNGEIHWPEKRATTAQSQRETAIMSPRSVTSTPQSLPFTCDFENLADTVNWTFAHNTGENRWCIGSATNNTANGSNALYVSNDNGITNAYTITSISVAWAYIDIDMGNTELAKLEFDFNCRGESSFDFVQVFAGPRNTAALATSVSGSTYTTHFPQGAALLGGTYHNLTSGWQHKTYYIEAIDTTSIVRLYFLWRNDGSVGTQPPAAIDNISITPVSCAYPTNLAATATETTIDFSFQSSASEWEVVFVPMNTPVNSSLAISEIITTTTHQYTNLIGATAYDIYARTICSASDTSDWAGPYTIRTLCPQYMAIPYTENFDSYGTGASSFPACWSKLGGASCYPNSTSPYSGTASLYFYNSSASASVIAIAPEIDTTNTPINTLSVSFKLRKTSTSTNYGGIQIGVMTDPNDASTFTMLHNITGSEYPSSTWTDFEFSLDQATAGSFIALRKTASTASHVYVDDFQVFSTPTCLRPMDLELVQVTDNSITLGWETRNQETSWQVVAVPAGTAPENGNSETVYENPCTISNLTDNTEYDVYVKSLCDAGDESPWSASLNCHTLCLPTDVIPFAENFGNQGVGENAFPACWIRRSDYTTSSYPRIAVISGDTALYFYASSTTYSLAASQALDLSNYTSGSLRVKFDVKRTSTTYGRMDVGFMTNPDDLNTFTPLKSIYNSDYLGTGLWESYDVPINYTFGDGNVYLVFLCPQGGSNYVYLDNVEVSEVPSCSAPSNLRATYVVGASTYLTWTPAIYGNPDYTIEYSEVGSDSWNVASSSVSGNSYHLFNLNPQTEYIVRVISNCSSDELLADSVLFSTYCLIGGDVAIGNGRAESAYVPVYAANSYSLTQQIYRAPEIGGNRVIRGIQFYAMAASANHTRNIDIYLGTSNQNDLSSNSYIPTSTQTLVYSGPFNVGNVGWLSIDFDTPFNYTGGNLILTIDDNTGSSYSGAKFYGNIQPPSIYKGGSTNYNPSTSQTGFTFYNYRNNVIFMSDCDSISTCISPSALIESLDNNSITLSWVPGFQETYWELEYKAINSSTWVSAGTVISSPYTIENLTAGTTYQIRLRSNCSNGDNSDWVILTAATECDYIDQLPYTQNFDAATASGAGNFIPCWYAGSNNASNKPYTSSTQSFSGTYSLYFPGSSTSYSYAVTPRFAESIMMNNLQVTFQARKSSAAYFIEVGIMSDPTDYSTFELLGSFSPAEVNAWEFGLVNTDQYVGTGKYIAFRTPQWISNLIYVDNIEITEIPFCDRVSNIEASQITSNSATITWTPGASETNWEVIYALDDQLDYDNAIPEIVTGTPSLTLSNLNANSVYNVAVRANCDNGETSGWMIISFRTDCGVISTLPYRENFESFATGSTVPFYCWTKNSTYSSTYPYVSSSQSTSGNNSLYFYGSNASSYSMVAMPQLSNELNANEIDVTLQMRASNTNTKLIVGVMSDPTISTSFVPVDTLTVSSTSSWNLVTATLSSYTGNGKYIAFKSLHSALSSIYVDDIVLSDIPLCPRPTDVEATSTISDTIYLSWNDPTGTEWDIIYGPTGFDPETSQDAITIQGVTTTNYTITGLTAGVIYDFYVRSVCSGDPGPWCIYPTQAIAYTIVMNQAFDVVASCGFTVVDNGGVNGNYSNNSNNILVIHPSSPDSLVSISGYFVGESTYDYLSIYEGNAHISGTTMDETKLLRKIMSGTSGNRITFNETSTTGALTLRFYADGSNVYEGFVANVSCVEAPTCKIPIDVTSTAIATHTADITWNVLGTDHQGFNIALSTIANFDPDTCTNLFTTTTNSYLLTGLSSNTQYYVMIQSDCGAGETSDWSRVYTFTTLCDLITTLPYTENFNSYGTGVTSYPNCWNRLSTYNSTTNYPYISSTNHSSPGSIYFYAGSNTYNIAIAQAIDITIYPINTLQATFWFRPSNAASKLIVGVMSNSTDASTFVPIDTVAGASSVWSEHTVYFSHYTGTGNQIAFKVAGTTSSAYGYLDDVTIDVAPSCISVSNINASNITTNSATLSWTFFSDETSWNIEYGPAGFTQGQGTVINATNNSYTLTSLTSGTLYDVYIQPNCGSGDSAPATQYTFATECDPITLPYTENFDSYTGTTYNVAGPTPSCWKTITNNTSYPAPHVIGSGSYWYPNSTPNTLSFTTGDAGNEAIAVLPAFNTTATELDLAFAYRMESATSGVLTVGYVTDMNNISTSFTTIETITSYTSVTLDTIFVSNLPTNARLAFRWTHNSSFYTCNIDDIYVGEHGVTPITPCDAPTNVVATPAQTTANVTWTSNASAWVVEYKVATATNWTASAQLSTPTYNITGLNPATDYVVRVKSICENGNESAWSTEVPFTTLSADIATYTITASATGPGTITPNGTVTVQEGDNATFTFAANANAVVAQVLVDAAAITTPADNSYTFSNVVANHTIEVVFEEEQTGINDMNMDAAVALFPNPATSEINIQMADNRFVSSTMQVYDVYGKLITTSEIVSQSVRLDVSAWANGVYIVRINSNEGIVTKRFVKR